MDELLSGIAVAGNIIIDTIKTVNVYPKIKQTASVLTEEVYTGGCVCNTAIDLKIIDSTLSVDAIGTVGNDANGRFAVETMERFGVDCSFVQTVSGEKTGHSDVMNVQNTGERTFFNYEGTDSRLSGDWICANLRRKFLHLGYLSLLSKLDENDGRYGTKAARTLAYAKERGISTSVDLVGSDPKRLRELTVPTLPYVDNLIINDTEAEAVSETEIIDSSGRIDVEAMFHASRKIRQLGVRQRVIIHTPELAACFDGTDWVVMPSCCLPQGWIVGTTGAGDAFCAGALYAIACGQTSEEILRFANSAAAFSLRSVDAIGGMRSKEVIQTLNDMVRCKRK